MKTAIAKTFLRPVVSGFRYSRGATDTLAPTPPIPSAPVARSGALSLQWICGIDADSGVNSTIVEVSPAGQNDWSGTQVPYPGTSVVVPNLLGLTPYDVRYSTVDNANPQNISAYTPIQTVTTLASDSALEPGKISLVTAIVTIDEGQQISVAVQRVGAGVSSPAVQADWQITGFSEGAPSPANGTVSWASGENGIKTILTTAGAVTQDRTGSLALVALRSLTGIIPPSYGATTSATLTVRDVLTNGKKFNPGMYAASDQHTYPDDSKRSSQLLEQNLVLSSGPLVLGIRMDYFPSCFQGSTLGTWDFTFVLRDLQRLQQMSTPKRLMVTVEPHIFNSTKYQNLLPASVYNNSSFGSSPVTGKYGFWTMNGGTDMTIAWWRPAVMDWIIEMYTAMLATNNPVSGLTMDNDPWLELTSFGETSMGVDPGSDFTTAAVVTQYKRLIDAVKSAKTLHSLQLNFTGNESQAEDLKNYCFANGIAIGGPDTIPGQLSWGMRAVIGSAQATIPGITPNANFTGPDLRGQVIVCNETQDPDMTQAKYGPPCPITTFNWVNDVIKQQYWIVVIVASSASNDPIPAYPTAGAKNTGLNPGNWHSVMQVINGNTLSNTQKPAYIGGALTPPVGAQTSVASNPVTVAMNATGPGVRYDVTNDAQFRAVPFGSLPIGSVINLFYKSTPYSTKCAFRTTGTAANPVTLNGVTDASGNRPQLNMDGAVTASGCNPSGGFGGANDIFSSTPAYGEQLGGIVIKRGPQDEYGHAPTYADSKLPAYIQLLNLDIFGVKNGATYTTLAGGTGTYSSNAAIWIQNGVDCLIHNCLLHDNGFGLFEMAKDGLLSQTCQRNKLSCSRIYNNGVVGSYLEHGCYRQGANPITEGCYIGQERPGAQGSSFKSRASGEIIRFNWIEASARALDLVHAEEQDVDGVMTQSDYGITWVYGNVIVNDFNLPNGGAGNAIHYGGDNAGFEDATTVNSPNFNPSPLIYRSQLYFHDNTYVIRATSAQSYRTSIFDLSLVGTKVDAWNNLIVLNGDSLFEWVTFSGTVNLRGKNLIYGTIAGNAHETATNPAKYAVNHLGTDITTDPRLTNIVTRDYTLGSGSPALDQSSTPAGVPTSMTLKTGVFPTTVSSQPRPASNGLVTRTTQGSALDLGALERGVS